MAIATAPTLREQIPAPPEIIAERFRGLTIIIGPNPHEGSELTRLENNSKLWTRLDRALEDLVYGLMQNDLQEPTEEIVQELHEVIKAEAIRRVVESRRADWDGGYPYDEAAS